MSDYKNQKSGVVKLVTGNGDWTPPGGDQLFNWEIQLECGTVGTCFTKKKDPWFHVGDTIWYTVTGSRNGVGKWKCHTTERFESQESAPNDTNSAQTPNDSRVRSILAQWALKCASNAFSLPMTQRDPADMDSNLKNVELYARKLVRVYHGMVMDENFKA